MKIAGTRRKTLAAIAIAGVVAFFALGLTPAQLVPQRGGLDLLAAFFSRAVSPALAYESAVPDGTTPILAKALHASLRTVVFAVAGMSLALLLGVLLAVPSSQSWWQTDRPRRLLGPAAWGVSRTLIMLMRSVHELLWAVLFLAAFGLTPFSAVIAIALPYGGTLAKIFSEMIDEAPRNSAEALRAAGASPLQIFAFGLVPRALPDMSAYAFYRFECAVRASAVLGFFGFETLGYYIRGAFDNLHYGEVWTYLYALILLVIAIDAWSGALRRRFVA